MVKHVTTREQFETLHELLAKVRANSKTVRVDVQALNNLLMDHSDMTHKLEGGIH